MIQRLTLLKKHLKTTNTNCNNKMPKGLGTIFYNAVLSDLYCANTEDDMTI